MYIFRAAILHVCYLRQSCCTVFY